MENKNYISQLEKSLESRDKEEPITTKLHVASVGLPLMPSVGTQPSQGEVLRKGLTKNSLIPH